MANIFLIGAAGGIGKAVVARLLERSDSVHASVSNDQGEASVRSITPGVESVIRLDFGDATTVQARLADELGRIGGIDAVIVCAAIGPLGPVETTPIEVVRRTMEVNYVSNVAVYQAAMPALRQSGGRIIFISSMAGIAALPFAGAYSASKFALEGVADVMRREAAPQGVKVVLVEPGGVQTPMATGQFEDVSRRTARLSEEERERYGYLYRGFLVMSEASHDSSSTPEQVADVIITALDAADPAPRYTVGADAEQLLALSRSGDLTLDAAFQQMYAEAGGA